MNQNVPQTLKGFRDFLPEAMTVRNYVKNLLIETFETFGFEPLETPTLELASVLKGKYSSETDDKLGYFFKDNGGRDVGLRYDLTVPVAKVLAIYANKITLPFKRYQIQPVWRADNTQKGRYREFYQCDIDTFGTTSPISDAELVSLIYNITQKLNFKKFTVLISSRTILINILNSLDIKTNQNDIMQSLDKLGKIGEEGVTKELIIKNLSQATITALFNSIKTAQPDENLLKIFSLIDNLGVSKDFYKFEPTLVRGPDYYTGMILETMVDEPKIGAIGGGGRYDKLIESLGGPNISAVGYSFGFERIIDCITELNLLPNLPKTKTKVLVANFGDETITQSLGLITTLRNNNVASSFYPDAEKLGKQFKYADSLGIPYVAIIGTNEAKNNEVTIKNMSTGEQNTINQSEILKLLL